ncbi:MAG: hypothetical protein JWN03_6421 [Nocardia sp.]|uniref:nuclear transport factor 2 family protein n=1 Tax=Nocardia sp. TaxID=1821 RepID=UPI002636FA74|nr:nuclear transport factor 2 family protein [Nocardia sp.]MCU1646146.1 hypothetical protein [Nocardia sp.]
MTTTHPTTETGWPVSGLFLEALANRDFSALSACLAPDVRFRGLIPPGPFDAEGAEATEARFRQWFGGGDTFEVLDATAGRLGSKLYLRWRIRMCDADGAARVAEQHVFATATDRIKSLDLLCSGWNPESMP